ncbi:hypothetical protein MTQ01_06200 [Streptomyces sp. XM4193]|uniref:hypothetical protein n=1 Tax=Streptomyces sp. XM4193 TaxID=2929782 RepID=UPI001FFAB190|nr:hypothetical protein [Streptomyces sp. XM4193]MCK1795604.1 hypothetical protein [Streptomyces sp. XM4193]
MTSPNFTALEAEALLRAAVIFKFDGGESAEVFSGSPHFANSLTILLESITSHYAVEGKSSKSKAWRETYRLSGNSERLEWVAHQAPTHPKWESLTDDEKRSWIDTLAAPYWLEDEDYARIC